MPPPSLSPERAKVAELYSARSATITPLPWQTFSPPFPMGYDPMSRDEASLFFRLVSYRYGRGAP